jgi:hypothetical protein
MAETKSDSYTEHMIVSEEPEKRRAKRLTTRDHDAIRKWAETRGAHPASSVRQEGHGIGVLRLEFPGQTVRPVMRIDWSDWFQAFDERELCFVYQEKNINGERSDFFRLELSG